MNKEFLKRPTFWFGITTILGVLMPWVTFEILTKVSINGFSTTSGKLIFIMGIINILISLIASNKRLHSSVSMLTGLMSLLFLFASYASLKKQAGSISPLIDAIPWQFGLYLTILSAVALLSIGFYDWLNSGGLASLKSGEGIKAFTGAEIKLNPESSGETNIISEVAAASEALYQQKFINTLSKLRDLNLKGPKAKVLIAIAALILIYLISLPLYNSSHNQQAIISKVTRAVETQDENTLSKLVVDQNGKPINVLAAKAYVTHYNKHLDILQNTIGSLANKPAKNSIDNLLFGTINNENELVKHSKLGYTSYRLKVKTVPLMVSSLKGSIFQIRDNKDGIEATGNPQKIGNFVNQVPVTLTVSFKTDWGNVTESQDVTPDNSTVKFDFKDYMYTINTDNLPKDASILINGKDSGQKINNSEDNLLKVGPLPKGQTYNFSVVSKQTFGDLTFSASSNDVNGNSNQIFLTADPVADKQILSDLAQLLDKLNTISVTPKGDASEFLAPGSPIASNYQPVSENVSETYNKMILYAKSLKFVSVNGQPALQVNTSEDYTKDVWGFSYKSTYCWQYTLMWDNSSKQWKEYDANSQYFLDTKNLASSSDIVITH